MTKPAVKKEYVICLDGCDESTEFGIELTDAAFALLDKIADLSKETSYYNCMPILHIREVKHEAKRGN